jgi:hypothetical protein
VPNFSIIRLPGRKYPGCLIQGDSLSYIFSLANNIYKKLEMDSDEDLIDDFKELIGNLASRLIHYEGVLKEHNLDTPYSEIISEEIRNIDV